MTEDYDSLHGLTTVGVGIGFFALVAFEQRALAAVVFALAAALGQGYYYKKYGKVRRDHSRTWLEVAVVVAVAAFVLPALLVDSFLSLPILIAPLCFAAGFVVFGKVAYRSVGATVVQMITVAVLAVSSLLPLTGLISTAARLNADFLLIGAAFVVIGIVDHIRLTRAMGSANVAH